MKFGKMFSFDFKSGDIGSFINDFKELSKAQQTTLLTSGVFNEQQNQLLATSAGLTISESGQVIATTELAASQTAATASTTGLSAAFTGLWATMKPILIGLATNPLTWITAATVAAIALEDALTIDYSEAHEALDTSTSKYQEAQSELEALKSEAESYKNTLSSIADNYDISFSGTETFGEMINKLNNADLSLVDQAEVDKIKTANTDLERQIELQEKLTAMSSKEYVNDAKTAMNTGDRSVAQSVKFGDSKGEKNFKDEIGNVTDTEAVKEDLALIEKFNAKIPELEKKVTSLKEETSNKSFWDDGYFRKNAELKSAQDELDRYKESIETLNSDLSSRSESIQSNLSALKLDPTGNSEAIQELENALNSINNIDLSTAEKELNSLDSLFSSTAGNTIGDYLNNIVAESGNAEDALSKFKELGLSLDDIGVSQDGFIKYFQDVAKSAEQAKEKASAVGTTLSDVDKAFESENLDANWKKFADYATQARDLAKQGKWGTDDLQKSIEWVLPKFNAKKELKKDDDLEYVADVYEKKYKDAEKLYKKFFDAENPQTSAANFQNALIDKGLLKEDKTGLTGTFDNTAEAAKKMKMSLEATETLLRNLESYGFEWDDVMFSGEGLKDYETALNNIKSLRDSMSEGNGKERLDGLIGSWDDEYAKYQKDLSSLSEDQIVHIEFEYDMAQIQSEIDQLQRLADEGDNTAKAALNAKKSEYRDRREKDTKFKESKSEGYSNASQKIKDLQSKFGDAKDDNARAKIQDQISAIYDLQNAFQDAFTDNKAVDWGSFLKSAEADKAFKSIEESTGLVRDDISKLLDIDTENIEVDATVNDEATPKLDGIISTITGIPKEVITELLAEDKASDHAINVLSAITGIPEETLTRINAINGSSGVLSLVISQLTGIPDSKVTELLATDNVSGLASLVIGSVSKIPNKHKTDLNATDNASQKAKAAKTAINAIPSSKHITIGGTISSTLTNAIATAKEKIRSISSGGKGKLNGTAHKDGTAKDKNTTTTLPLSKKGVSEKTGGLYPIPKLSGRALASGTLEDETWLNPNWKTKKDEDALTGELGQEMVVYGNRWYTVGDDGAEFTHIPAGSVVFNAKQTKELLKNGFTPSRGTARLSGTAHLEGTAYASGNGGRKLTVGSSTKKKKAKKSTKTSSKKNTSKKSTKKSEKDSKKFKESFDWIEVAIDRIERAIDSLDLKASSVYRSWSDRNTSLKSEIANVNTEIKKQQQGYDRYMKEADKVGLASKWKKKVQNGTIDISTVKDEKLANKIKEYQQW